ncbi:MAG TPA: TOBE domain-containing protein, partial [Alphaproteobacteria bacterium]|nr:TOBE domain-containing protein [Alphaproteobacteria bacterium]
DKVVVMYDGEIVQIGTPAELFDRPSHTFVGYFIGSPGMNVMPAEVAGDRARIAGRFELALPRAYPALGGGRIELGVRPEFTWLAPPAEGLPVQVRSISDLGRLRLAKVDLGGQTVVATVPDGLSIAGSEASLRFEPAMMHVYADGSLVRGEAH